MANDRNETRDLVLVQGQYAALTDDTKGIIRVYVGPTYATPTGTEVGVLYNPATSTFDRKANVREAIQSVVDIKDGSYAVLDNPAEGNSHPEPGKTSAAVPLDYGRSINVQGPQQFALWPGQSAQVIPGHQLRSNQYLLVRIRNGAQATENWKLEQKVMKEIPAADGKPARIEYVPEQIQFTTGDLLIIKGTEDSFFIPPSGVEVVSENDGGMTKYVRDALTLERLEYAVLVDENGNKRYERGPAVVFPQPTETFTEAHNDKGLMVRKFRAIELNPLQGVHVKVIADYEENGKSYKTGDELFITGKETQIYYPREEHAAVKYDGQSKSFATAIPPGQGRYVLNRMTGEIRLVKGPAMLLPDPRTEVMALRALTDRECELWYPGNMEVLEYNQSLRQAQGSVPTTRAGALSVGDVTRNAKGIASNAARQSRMTSDVIGGAQYSTSSFMESSKLSGQQKLVGDEVNRSANYTAPRTVDLSGKFGGAISLDIWTGFAVQVVSRTGTRRVVLGPATVLLAYDETLEAIALSTGKPKTTDRLHHDVYLRAENNKVSDVIRIETADHVQVDVKVVYRVNFLPDASAKWFKESNYVKLLTDHARSLLKGAVQRTTIDAFYANSTEVVRSTLLAEGRLTFEENGMAVKDVEVLDVRIVDDNIRQLLTGSQVYAVQNNVELANLRLMAQVTEEKAKLEIVMAQSTAMATEAKHEIEEKLAASSLDVALSKINNALTEAGEAKKLEEAKLGAEEYRVVAKLKLDKSVAEQKLTLTEAEQAQRIAMLKAEVEAVVSKLGAAGGNFTEAILALSNNETLEKVARALSVQTMVGGNSLVEAIKTAFNGTPMQAVADRLTQRMASGQK